MRKYFNTCPLCGSNLDPNEKCDCEAEKRPAPVIPNKYTGDNAEGQIKAFKRVVGA